MSQIENENLLVNYLNKHYLIKENRFFTIYDDYHEWGYVILESLPKIFSFENYFCENVFKNWAYLHGLTTDTLDFAWRHRKLHTTFSPILIEFTEVVQMLSKSLAYEIESQLLKDLTTEFKTSGDLFSIVKCIGYEPTMTFYDENTFKPKKYFISMKFNDIERERQNNTMWQNYIRAAKSDNQTP